MTPINRLIPRGSGPQGPRRSEMETSRVNVGGTAGMTSMRPATSSDSQGDALVEEILRDSSQMGGGEMYDDAPQRQRLPPPPRQQQAHPSQYQEPEYIEEEYEELPPRPTRRSVRFDDEGPRERPPSPKKDDDDSDYIGFIFNEMKMPLIVALLIMGASSTNLDGVLSRVLPAFVADSGLGYIGSIIKAIVGGLLFYALRRIFL